MSHSRFAGLAGSRGLFVPLIALTLTTTAGSLGCRSSSSSPSAAAGENTWATVDGREITKQQVENAFKRTRDTGQPLSYEEEMTAKLSLLNDLILQDILLAKANALKVTIPDNELTAAYDEASKNMTPEAYQQELSRRGLTAADMREGLRREMLTQKVITQEVGSKVSVSDKEVTDFFEANKAQFNVAEEAYHLAQIVITPGRDQQIANRTGDDAATPEQAVTKVKMLMERLKSGASFRDLAVGYSEDPESAPRGGDLGFVPISRIKQAAPPLRDAVLNKAPGSVNVVNTGNSFALMLVVAHVPAGQRDLSTPGVKEGITDQIRGRKEQLLRAAYLTAARTDAQVVNHLARRLVQNTAAAATPASGSAPVKQ